MCIIKIETIFSHHLEFTIALYNILNSFLIHICPWYLFQWIISCHLMCKDVWWLLLRMDVFLLCHMCYPFVLSYETCGQLCEEAALIISVRWRTTGLPCGRLCAFEGWLQHLTSPCFCPREGAPSFCVSGHRCLPTSHAALSLWNLARI